MHKTFDCIEMIDQEVLGYDGRKKRSPGRDIAGETNSGNQRSSGAFFVASQTEMKCIEHIQTSKFQRLAGIFDWSLRAQAIVQAPVTDGNRSASRHYSERRNICFQ